MARMQNHKALLTRLKKQVKLLEKKETRHRDLLLAALKRMRALGTTYKSHLAGKMQIIKAKMAVNQANVYGKVAANLEQQLQKDVKKPAANLEAKSKPEKG